MMATKQLVYCYAGGHYYFRAWSLAAAPERCRHKRKRKENV